ncbi:MAG: radical SAM family heme chaperone HemW [Candidatus Nanopelagicaceae bacterium]
MSRRLSFYVHIPYCVKRCGYCDFNTYTPTDLLSQSSTNNDSAGVQTVANGYIDLVIQEIELARRTVGKASVPTIFFGGGTPTLLPARDLVRIVDAISGRFSLERRCEITVEANPDSVTKESLATLRAGGINRISFGMQSAVPHVLKVLDRTHRSENLVSATQWAKEVGFDHISVDLIYGTPGESLNDWKVSIDAALALPIDHISAYALIVEQGTKLARQVNSGEITMPDDDETAEKYRMADDSFSQAGFTWYELSNWARPGGECRHNIAYWQNSEWWGLGPGAHSHIENSRWWNVKHPNTYRAKITANETPIQEREELSLDNQRTENLMLAIRMKAGIALKNLSEEQCVAAEKYVGSEHLDLEKWERGALVLTQSGRLIADRIVRELLV